MLISFYCHDLLYSVNSYIDPLLNRYIKPICCAYYFRTSSKSHFPLPLCIIMIVCISGFEYQLLKTVVCVFRARVTLFCKSPQGVEHAAQFDTTRGNLPGSNVGRTDRRGSSLDATGSGAWPFQVRGVICLVNSDNGRDSRRTARARSRHCAARSSSRRTRIDATRSLTH